VLSVATSPGERDATDYKFWCQHHRESAKWLAIRVHQVLVEGNDSVKPILLASLPQFIKEYAHPSNIRFPPSIEEED
jgi:hypothetical protein